MAWRIDEDFSLSGLRFYSEGFALWLWLWTVGEASDIQGLMALSRDVKGS